MSDYEATAYLSLEKLKVRVNLQSTYSRTDSSSHGFIHTSTVKRVNVVTQQFSAISLLYQHFMGLVHL